MLTIVGELLQNNLNNYQKQAFEQNSFIFYFLKRDNIGMQFDSDTGNNH
jgi:hypothetical protein